jgi:fibronectin type 3 domain-containing protein
MGKLLKRTAVLMTTVMLILILFSACDNLMGALSVDKNALTTAINNAKTAMAGAVVSVDGSDLSASAYWVTQAEQNALETAIANAETVSTAIVATQQQVDTATNNLNSAIRTFNAAKKEGTNAGGVDKTTLSKAISAAKTAKEGTVVSLDGSELSASAYWVTQTVMNTLDTAIATADTVRYSASAIQTQVDTATDTLTTALGTFNAAKRPGTNTGGGSTANKTSLIMTISAAQIERAGAVVSGNGSDLSASVSWVTQATVNALDTAIATAETVRYNASATQTQVDAATDTLNNALGTFNAAKKPGTNTGGVDKVNLIMAIGAATTAKTGVAVSNVNGLDVDAAKFWVTQAESTALNTAIDAAEAVRNDSSATLEQVNFATITLNNAVATFTVAKKPGKASSQPAAGGITITGLPTRLEGVTIGVALLEQRDFGEDSSPVSFGEDTVRNGSVTVALWDSDDKPWTGSGSWYVAFAENRGQGVAEGYITNDKKPFSSGSATVPFSNFEAVALPEPPDETGVTITGLPQRFNGAEINVALLEQKDFFSENPSPGGFGIVQNSSITVALELWDEDGYTPWSGSGSWYVAFIEIIDGNPFAGGSLVGYITKTRQPFSSGSATVPFSNFEAVEIEIPVQTVLPAPANLQASLDGNTVHLTWDPVNGAESYNIYRDGSIHKASYASYSEAGLAPGTYSYRVVAVDSNGNEGEWSGFFVSVTVSVPVPTGLYASLDGNTVNLSWNSVNGASYYRVYRDGSYSGDSYGAAAFTDENLAPGTYYYQVAAVDSYGYEGERSASVSVTVTVSVPVPTGLYAYSDGNTVNLNWNSVNGASYYRVYRDGSYSGDSKGAAAITDENLAPGTYYYQVSAVNSYGYEGELSASFSVTVSRLPAPVGLYTSLNGNIVNFSWYSVNGASYYKIYRSNSSGAYELISNYGSDITYSEGLSAGTYYYQVSAVDSSGNEGERSASVPVTLSVPVPTGLYAYSDGDTVNLSWNSVNDASYYKVYRGNSSGAYDLITYISGAMYSEGLSPGTYYYQVSAVDSYGNESERSMSVSVTVLPLAPTGLYAYSDGNTANLNWNSVNGAVSYRVYRSESYSGEYTFDSYTTAFTDEYLAPGTYYYQVSAVDSYGYEGAKSESVSVTIYESSVTQ